MNANQTRKCWGLEALLSCLYASGDNFSAAEHAYILKVFGSEVEPARSGRSPVQSSASLRHHCVLPQGEDNGTFSSLPWLSSASGDCHEIGRSLAVSEHSLKTV